MLDSLFVNPAVAAITEALTSARAVGPVVVIGHAKLAAALRPTREVLAVGMTARAARRLGDTIADTTALEPGAVAAVIGADVATSETWAAQLHEWTRIVRDGGVIVLVDRGHAAEASRRALCAGLTEIEQRHDGRTIVTSGVVTRV